MGNKCSNLLKGANMEMQPQIQSVRQKQSFYKSDELEVNI